MQKQIKTSLGGVYVHLEITDCTFPFCLQDFPLSHRGLIYLVMGHTSDSYTGNCDVQMWSVPAPQETSRTHGRLFPEDSAGLPEMSHCQKVTIQAFAVLAMLSHCGATSKARKHRCICQLSEGFSGQRSSWAWRQGSALLTLLVRPAVVLPGCPQEGQDARVQKERKRRTGTGMGPVNEAWCQQGTQAKPGVQQQCCQPIWLSGLVLLAQAARRAELLLGTGTAPGEVQEASFTPDLCQVILVPLSSLCPCWAGLAGVNMAK